MVRGDRALPHPHPRGAGAGRSGERAGRERAGPGADLLKDLQDEFGLSYVFISHDLEVVRFISDEMLVMKDGVVVEQASAAQILASPREDSTKRLLEAIPRGYRAAA